MEFSGNILNRLLNIFLQSRVLKKPVQKTRSLKNAEKLRKNQPKEEVQAPEAAEEVAESAEVPAES